MKALRIAFSTTVTTKFVVAATGAMLALFVLVHMAGNLQVFVGPEPYNAYAATLKGLPGPLWAARLGLLAAFVLHIWGNLRLRARNRAARPVAYRKKQPIVSSLASRTMLPSGLILLAFVVYHLAHFTFGWLHPEFFRLTDAQGRHDVYSMLVLGFRQPVVAASYLVAMALLFLHLTHGVASLFQTAGWRTLTFRQAIDGAGRLFAIVVTAGNIAVVLACLFGLVEPMQEVL